MNSPNLSPAIIISTGRCGSTLLSDLIAEQPDTLSVQEFFMVDGHLDRSDDVLSGTAYWAMMSSPDRVLATLFQLGLAPGEVCYPKGGRWASNLTALPRILATTLPKVSSDPDGLFDVLAHHVPAFPRQRTSRHHQMFLDLLTSLTGRRRWVERSGGSSHFAPYLLKNFPTAKIVYLTRGREDTARSMSRHPWYQLIELRIELLARYGLDPFRVPPGQPVPEELERYLPDRLTAETLRERGRNESRYRGLYAFLTSQAEQAITDAPPRHLLEMTYEDLVAEPVTQLSRLGKFLEFDDWEGWASSAAKGVGAPSREHQAGRIISTSSTLGCRVPQVGPVAGRVSRP